MRQLLYSLFALTAFSVSAATFQASGPTNETYGGSGTAIEVTFASTPAKMQFRFPFYGLMIPGALTNGNDSYYINGWAEGYDSPNQNANWNAEGHSYEPTSNNDPGYNHVAYWIESQDATRIVVRHRYALIRSNVVYNSAWVNPVGKQGEWVDQWYIFSPDGTHIKKTRVYTQDATNTKPWVSASGDERVHEVEGMYWMNFGRPNHRVHDDIETNYWTLIKMDGSAHDIDFDYGANPSPTDFAGFGNANIQLLNTRATTGLDPFRIGRNASCINSAYQAGGAQFAEPIPHFGNSNAYQIAGIGDLYMDTHWQVSPGNYVTEIWLNGYTSAGDDGGNDGGADAGPELARLARSWTAAPTLSVTSGASSASFDLGQRAYLVSRSGAGPIQGQLSASDAQPFINGTFFIRDWGNDSINVSVGSQVLSEGTNFHVAYHPLFSFEDSAGTVQQWTNTMVLWVQATETNTAAITIAPNANAPVIQQGSSVSVTIDEDEQSLPWSPPTIHATNPIGGTGSLVWSLANPPANGAATVSGSGASPVVLDYTPNTNFSGSDSFVVQVSNGTSTDSITVNVTVNGHPDNPTAVNDIATTPMNATADLDVLANDYDIDGQTVTISAIGTTTYGTAINNTTNITYIPNNGVSAVTDVFTYTIDDGTGRSDIGTISITIGGGQTGSYSTNVATSYLGTNISRNVDIHVPASYDGSPMPVLFVYHNFNDTPAGAATKTSWNTTADANGFIVVYPEARDAAYDVDGGGPDKAWELPDGGIGIDNADLHFTTDILDWLETQYNVRTTHVFSSGFSTSGNFAYFAAAMLHPRITGFTEQSGSFTDGGTWFWPANMPAGTNFIGYILHSPTDPWVTNAYAQTLYSGMTNRGYRAYYEDFSSNPDPGHAWTPARNQDQWTWLMANAPAIDDPPTAIAGATPKNGTAPLSVSFTGSSSTDDNGISGYSWDFGDGGNSTATNPDYIYTNAGNFLVSLSVIDTAAQTSVAYVAISVQSNIVTATTNGAIPFAWLAAQNSDWTNNYEAAAASDPDNDGFTTIQEYWIGTDPDSSNSYPKIDILTIDGTNITLEWRHASVNTNLPSITIERTTDLATGTWSTVGFNSPTNGLHIWTDGTPLPSAYYRLSSTNAP